MPAPIPVHAQFTDEEKDRVTILFHSGVTQADIGKTMGRPARTIGKLLNYLNLKRDASSAGSLKMKSNLDDPTTIELIARMRQTHSLREIVDAVGGSISSVDRICRKYNITVPDNYADLQSNRMKSAWGSEKREKASMEAKESITDDLRKRLSDGSKELWKNPDYRRRQEEKQKIVWSDITLREKMAEILTDYWDDSTKREAMAIVQSLVWTPEKRLEMSEIQSKIWADPERRKRISEISRIVWADPAMRMADSERVKKIWESDEFRDRMAKARELQPRVSSIQTTLYSILDDLGVSYYREYQNEPADPQCTIGPYNFDCVIPRQGKTSLVVECQGDYWHSLQGSVRVDRSKATYIARYHSNTHELKYLWEHEFKCKDKIVETVKYWLDLARDEIIDFNIPDLTICKPPALEYKLLLSKYHYLANAGRGGITFGARLGDTLVAVCVFSPLIRQNVDTLEFDHSEAVELSRLCVHPRYQKPNLLSWFVSRCLKQLDTKYRLVISYCDTTFNHNGATYKALNFEQDRIIHPDYWYVDADGWVMHKKTLYGRAIQMSMKESEYADQFGYRRVYGSDKLRFVYKR